MECRRGSGVAAASLEHVCLLRATRPPGAAPSRPGSQVASHPPVLTIGVLGGVRAGASGASFQAPGALPAEAAFPSPPPHSPSPLSGPTSSPPLTCFRPDTWDFISVHLLLHHLLNVCMSSKEAHVSLSQSSPSPVGVRARSAPVALACSQLQKRVSCTRPTRSRQPYLPIAYNFIHSLRASTHLHLSERHVKRVLRECRLAYLPRLQSSLSDGEPEALRWL